ncbi:multisubunit potassium/proton antiporter PhaE subunit [Comamonas sp. BIGb0124]|uniref:Na+/H+ antiporter subunit E n=1 Tax=Comamonas sp. BIGb0124 TaxID=2485130 RepID=UPI000F47CC3C|nr:Na+/H+ antiporter subunit E [Comamonas sp. BIGb0124]ROR21525.1 multisubunit potassium/proton antiporter PhaE subunit [Comamonas sp. BIGb0124]
MIKRLLPSPILSLVIAVLWLMLNQSLGAGDLLMALLLAWVVPLFTNSLRPTPVRIRKPWLFAKLVLLVNYDILVSNLKVARLILRPGANDVPSRFVRIPLDVRDPNALAVLSIVLCLTPGTAWGEIALDRSALLMHVLELKEEEADDFVAMIKRRYERPLMEIFE